MSSISNSSSRPKSILKYKPETNNVYYNTASTPASSSSVRQQTHSWLSRLQQKINPNLNGLYDDNDRNSNNTSPSLIPKQKLKKVSFSVGQLVIEHTFSLTDYNDVPITADTDKEEENGNANMAKTAEPKSRSIDTKRDRKVRRYNARDLASYYEQACIQQEEGCIERFRNILKACRTEDLPTIDLFGQPITKGQAGPIADVLLLNFGLTYLNLSSCRLSDETLHSILCSLLVSNTIKKLKLARNSFRSKGFKHIAIFIKESKTIDYLDLSQCPIDKRGMEYLAQGLKYATTLSTLHLNLCTLKLPQETYAVLSEAVYNANSLQYISLHGHHFASVQFNWIANLIANNRISTAKDDFKGLKELDLSGSTVDSMMASFASKLRHNKKLRVLNLSHCKITFKGLSLLSDAIADNTCLKKLDLSNNPLGEGTDEGLLALKTALARNRCLQDLNLSETNLNSSSAIALAEALPENSSLSRLDLSKNPIGMAGVMALSVSIKMNRSLTFLDINISPLDEDMANLQNDIVAVCTTNMLQKVEAQNRIEKQAQTGTESSTVTKVSPATTEEITDSNTTLSTSSSSLSSSSTSTTASTLQNPSTSEVLQQVHTTSIFPKLPTDCTPVVGVAPSATPSPPTPEQDSQQLNVIDTSHSANFLSELPATSLN